jgi:hypothetical protein
VQRKAALGAKLSIFRGVRKVLTSYSRQISRDGGSRKYLKLQYFSEQYCFHMSIYRIYLGHF